MKLIRWGIAGEEKPGVIINDKRYNTSAFGEDYNETFFETNGLDRLQKFISANDGTLPAIAESERWGSPITRPSKLICIGLNQRYYWSV
jgi:2,4-diketo-3-deoxy-L-fuconate hydrolase